MIRQSMPSGLTRGCESFGEKIRHSSIIQTATGRKTDPLVLIASRQRRLIVCSIMP
jgi:hypothetical protein